MSGELRSRGIPEFCDRWGIGRTRFYEEVRLGRLKVLKVGSRSIITPAHEQAWLDSLPELKPGSTEPQPAAA